MGSAGRQSSIMVVPDSIRDKVGPLPDVSSMNKDDLSALCMKLYDQSCAVFQEKYQMEQLVKKRDAEIHNLEMEATDLRWKRNLMRNKIQWSQSCCTIFEIHRI